MPKGNAKMIKKGQTKNGLSLVKRNRFPEGVPAVGPRADTKVVGCLRGGKIVNLRNKRVSSIFHAARFNEIITSSLCLAPKEKTKSTQKRKKTKNALVLFSIIGFQKECPLLGHVPTLR